MEKKQIAFCCCIILVIICGSLLLSYYYNPEPFNDMGQTMHQSDEGSASGQSGSRDTRRVKLFIVAGIFLFTGSMLWRFFLKAKKGSRVDGSARVEMASTSLLDWSIALLVISVGLILPVLLAVFFGFSHFW